MSRSTLPRRFLVIRLLLLAAAGSLAGCADQGDKMTDQMIKNFGDRPVAFEGRRMHSNLTYEDSRPLREYGELLKDGAQKIAFSKFYLGTTKEAVKVKFTLTLPQGYPVETLPDAKQQSTVYVCFDCTEGSLTEGNTIVTIE